MLLNDFLVLLQSFLDLVICGTSTLHFKFELYMVGYFTALCLQSFSRLICPVSALRIDSSLAYMSWLRIVWDIVSCNPRDSISRLSEICSVIYSKLCLSSPICLSSFMSRSTCFWYSVSNFSLHPIIQIRQKFLLTGFAIRRQEFLLLRHAYPHGSFSSARSVSFPDFPCVTRKIQLFLSLNGVCSSTAL